MRFKISPVETAPEEVMGIHTNYDTAKDLIVFQTEVIEAQRIDENKWKFNNGFIPETIRRNKYIPEESKEALIKFQATAKKRFAKEQFGDEKYDVSEYNKFLWEKPEWGSIDITNDTTNMIYDTDKELKNLLLYCQIMSSAYWFVAVNEAQAQLTSAPYFIQEIKDAELRENRDDMNKVEAISKIFELSGKGDKDGLLYLTWVLGNDKDNMAGYSSETTTGQLVTSLYNFVEGKTRERDKRQTVSEFSKAYGEYLGDRDTFMAKAITRIADYHSLIYTNKEKEYTTSDNTVLGRTLDTVVDFLLQKKNRDILDKLTKEAMQALSSEF